MKRMTSRFESVCGTCKKPITKGADIVYMGSGVAHHAECYDANPGAAQAAMPDTRRQSRFHRPSSYRPAYHGRCEDAPCCGCCS
jgi:hypothetical protein